MLGGVSNHRRPFLTVPRGRPNKGCEAGWLPAVAKGSPLCFDAYVPLHFSQCSPSSWVRVIGRRSASMARQTRSSPDVSISLSTVASGSSAPAWSGITGLGDEVDGSPAIDHGVLYVGDADDRLFAFDATGTTNCSGTPKTCAPLWTGATGASTGVDVASPTVANDVVYIGSDNNKLYAFDATGTTNCSGTPKTCAPLWTAATGGAVFSPPVVANGVVYVGSEDHKVYVFDAAGNTNCSGTPKTCTPLWTATTGGAVEANLAVANGILYVGSQVLYAFDAAGNTNCSGTPKTCTPLWTGNTAAPVTGIAVAGGMVYAGAGSRSFPGGGVGVLYAFAAGTRNCSNLGARPFGKAGLADAPFGAGRRQRRRLHRNLRRGVVRLRRSRQHRLHPKLDTRLHAAMDREHRPQQRRLVTGSRQRRRLHRRPNIDRRQFRISSWRSTCPAPRTAPERPRRARRSTPAPRPSPFCSRHRRSRTATSTSATQPRKEDGEVSSSALTRSTSVEHTTRARTA